MALLAEYVVVEWLDGWDAATDDDDEKLCARPDKQVIRFPCEQVLLVVLLHSTVEGEKG